MVARQGNKAIWGWMFFDWAAQPFHTLMVTFIFAPYFTKHVVGDPVQGQAIWGYGLAATGLTIAVLAPIFGAIADTRGSRRSWVWLFSGIYVCAVAALWMAEPNAANPWMLLAIFGLALLASEMTATFTNASLTVIASGDDVGRVSGQGWAFGYIGGLVALGIVLGFLAEGPDGTPMLSAGPLFGLDPEQFEGTRAAGPFSAIWYVVFMVPFFVWVPSRGAAPSGGSVRSALADLRRTLAGLPQRPSLLAYLLSSMFFRDALNGVFAFGAIYAVGVLNWSTTQIGIFGIAAAATGALGAWLGGRMDGRFGPHPVLYVSMAVLILASLAAISAAPGQALGMALAPGSGLPDTVFLVCGMLFGAAGGSLQAAGRTGLIRQADPERITEAFGLYALAGRATAFLAPLAIAITTDFTGSQRAGILPVVVLFAIAFVLLMFVRSRPQGER